MSQHLVNQNSYHNLNLLTDHAIIQQIHQLSHILLTEANTAAQNEERFHQLQILHNELEQRYLNCTRTLTGPANKKCDVITELPQKRKNLKDNRLETVTHDLDRDDAIESMWPSTYDGKYCHIILSKKRVLFVEEHGFLNTTAQVILNLPYHQIHSLTLQCTPQLQITTEKGKTITIASPHLNRIHNHIEHYIKSRDTPQDNDQFDALNVSDWT
jgi:hypothetical protein